VQYFADFRSGSLFVSLEFHFDWKACQLSPGLKI
jgi:hypothetical protein